MIPSSLCQRAVFLLACVLAVAGCTREVEFRVVDAATHEPLEGASVELVRLRYDYVFDALSHDRLQPMLTGDNGIVVAELASEKPIYQITFKKEGYYKAFAHPNIERKHVVKVTSPVTQFPPPPGGAELVSGEGVVEIPMYRSNGGDGAPTSAPAQTGTVGRRDAGAEPAGD